MSTTIYLRVRRYLAPSAYLQRGGNSSPYTSSREWCYKTYCIEQIPASSFGLSGNTISYAVQEGDIYYGRSGTEDIATGEDSIPAESGGYELAPGHEASFGRSGGEYFAHQ